MLENLAKILVVDNDQRELDFINKTMYGLNIPASYILYSSANPPPKPFSGIRLVFFDIQLQNGGGGLIDTNAINAFSNAIKHCIDINNGPFILVFWTSHIEDIENIKEHIEKREKDTVPAPLIIDMIDKTVAGNEKALSDAIKRILTNDILELLFDYDEKISQASGKTLKTIFSVASEGKDKWGESNNFVENFDLVISNIANETLGYNNAKQNPLAAIRDGLNPILVNELNGINLSVKWRDKMKWLLESDSKIQFKKIGFDHICKLNSIYHFNFNIDFFTKRTRGIVLEIEMGDPEMILLFGKERKQIRHAILPLDSAMPKGEKQKIKDGSQFVLLEISSSCDHAQDNPRNFTYLLGIIVRNFDENYLRKSESIIRLPNFYYKNEGYFLFFNSRYILSTTELEPVFFKDILFRIKSELMNKITTQHSNYISRLGVIQF